MLVATRSFTHNGEQIKAGRTRIAPDHEWAHKFRSAFAPDPDGPPSEGDVRYTKSRAHVRESRSARAATRPPKRSRMPLEAEIAVRDRTLAGFGDKGRIESASGRRSREFWEATDGYLNRLDPARVERWHREEREAEEHRQNVQAIARLARAELDAACEGWREWSAPLN